MSNKPGEKIRVDAAELIEACRLLGHHRKLVEDSLMDIGLDYLALTQVIAAVRHVVEDGFRSSETRGGS